MSAANYTKVLGITLKHEGGWANHPKDPGGATMKGVTQRTYDAYRDRMGLSRQSVRCISDPELQAIYREGYWDVVNGDGLAPGVDLATFDAAVNSGPGRALKWLKASIGGPDDQTVKRQCAKRLSFVQALGTWGTFGKGWARRIAEIEATGVAWALAAQGLAPAAVEQVTKGEAELAQTKASNRAKAAQTTSAGSAGSGGSTTQVTDDTIFWLLAAGGVALALITLFLAYRVWVNRARAAAYAEIANA